MNKLLGTKKLLAGLTTRSRDATRAPGNTTSSILILTTSNKKLLGAPFQCDGSCQLLQANASSLDILYDTSQENFSHVVMYTRPVDQSNVDPFLGFFAVHSHYCAVVHLKRIDSRLF